MRKLAYFFAVIVLFSACKKEGDSTKPTVTSLIVNGSSDDVQTLQAGDFVEVKVQMEDNDHLNQLKVNVHAATDDHGVSGGLSHSDVLNQGAWNFTQILNLSGTSDSRTVTFQIPDSVQGYWHVQAFVIDDVGNASAPAVKTLNIQNYDLPTFNLTFLPDYLDAQITVPLNDSILISGLIHDNDGLFKVRMNLVRNSNSYQYWTWSQDSLNATNFNLSNLSTGALGVPGAYKLYIHAFDFDGLHSYIERKVTVQ